MKICVYNVKGGVGKTTIAVNLALEMNYSYITNDVLSPVEILFDDDFFIKVGPQGVSSEDYNFLDSFPEIPDDANVIYDLSGAYDSRMIKIIEQSDWFIVPTLSDYINQRTTYSFLNSIQEISDRIVIVVNKAAGLNFVKAREKFSRSYDYPIFEIKNSEALTAVFKHGKPLSQNVEEGGPLARSCSSALNQLGLIMKHLTET